jgi:hypothetical protein
MVAGVPRVVAKMILEWQRKWALAHLVVEKSTLSFERKLGWHCLAGAGGLAGRGRRNTALLIPKFAAQRST